jgi:hypothetical protein
MMDIPALLQTAGVPAELHAEAAASLAAARAATGGTLSPMLLRKFRARWFRAGRIAKALPWEANRLIDVRPDWADDDIAPALNITANGDNGLWIETPEGGRPVEHCDTDNDPASPEYRAAVARNYWLPGTHPRSQEARKAWYRRNGGEYLAWRLGIDVDTAQPVREWSAPGITVLRCGNAWQIDALRKVTGPLKLLTHIGFEVGNVFASVNGQRVQSWYPVPGHALRACVTWAVYPVVSSAAAV